MNLPFMKISAKKNQLSVKFNYRFQNCKISLEMYSILITRQLLNCNDFEKCIIKEEFHLVA